MCLFWETDTVSRGYSRLREKALSEFRINDRELRRRVIRYDLFVVEEQRSSRSSLESEFVR